MWEDGLKAGLRRWLIAALMCTGYLMLTSLLDSCQVQPAAAPAPRLSKMAEQDAAAAQAASELDAVYSSMSDKERMRGVVLEDAP